MAVQLEHSRTADIAALTRSLEATSLDVQLGSCDDLLLRISELCNAVYKELGPNQSESTYQRALKLELEAAGASVLSEEIQVPIMYKARVIGHRRPDLVVTTRDNVTTVFELKAVAALTSKHLKQLEYYLAHLGIRTGLLVNFPHEDGFPIDHGEIFQHEVLQGQVSLSDRATRSRVQRGDRPEIVKVQNAHRASEPFDIAKYRQCVVPDRFSKRPQAFPAASQDGSACVLPAAQRTISNKEGASRRQAASNLNGES